MSLRAISNVSSRELKKQAECIRVQQLRGKPRRLLESKLEIEGLEKCYRHIETLFRQLQVRTGDS